MDLKNTISRITGVDDSTVRSGTQAKVKRAYGTDSYNPFLNKNGQLVNPYMDYQKVLDNPNVTSKAKEFIQSATGLSPTVASTSTGKTYSSGDFSFDGSVDENNLASLDVKTTLPKLSEQQISTIITKHFSKSPVISASDAKGIFDAQQSTGMSALAILGIGALESGWGTSNIAKKKNNLWGWDATNVNPAGNAKSFSPVAEGAAQFANSYLRTYYNKYGAKSIYSAGTGKNSAGKGYAYNDDGSINKAWASNVNGIMKQLYRTAKSANSQKPNALSGIGNFVKNVGQKIANTASYKNSASVGQCVWYVRGRMKEKFGKETGAIGNGNQMWYNAKASAKVSASADNLRPNMIVSYGKGTSTAGQKYGHVIYIEDVVGDTVYYTEGGSGYHKNGTDGVVKTATRQGIMQGINSAGKRIGSDVIGFIDVTKY